MALELGLILVTLYSLASLAGLVGSFYQLAFLLDEWALGETSLPVPDELLAIFMQFRPVNPIHLRVGNHGLPGTLAKLTSPF